MMSVEIVKHRGYTFVFDDDQRVSLTGLWKQMGALPKKRPALWLKSEVAKDFMANVIHEAGAGDAMRQKVEDESEFAYWKLALLYCAYLSPKMKAAFIKVIRQRFGLDNGVDKETTYFMEEIESSS